MATLHSDALNPQFGGGYQPSANEEFMNPEQLAYFRQKLLAWKDSIVRESRETMTQLASGPIQEADLTDRASSETDWGIHLRTRDRQRKLISRSIRRCRMRPANTALRNERRAVSLAASGPADRDDDRRGPSVTKERTHLPRRLSGMPEQKRRPGSSGAAAGRGAGRAPCADGETRQFLLICNFSFLSGRVWCPAGDLGLFDDRPRGRHA